MKHVAAWPNFSHRASIIDQANGTRYQRGRTVFFEDLGGAPLEELKQRAVRLVAEAQAKYQSTKLVTEIFVVFPATLSFTVDRLLMPLPTLRWKQVHKSYPHLSMEDPPDFGDLCSKKKPSADIQCHSVLPWLKKKCNQMALVVYQLQFPHVSWHLSYSMWPPEAGFCAVPIPAAMYWLNHWKHTYVLTRVMFFLKIKRRSHMNSKSLTCMQWLVAICPKRLLTRSD